MNRLLLLLGIFGLLASPARAEIMAASSVECLTCQAELVLVGEVITIDQVRGYQDCTVVVHELIKGEVEGRALTLSLRSLSPQANAKPLLKTKSKLLLFLTRSKDHGSERHLDGKLVPVSGQFPLSVFDLSKLPTHVYSKDMRVISDPDALLTIVRKSASCAIPDSIWVDVPGDSAIHQRLYSGSACYLAVPAEEKFRARFMQLARSDKAHDRQRAAAELKKFPGPQTERVLRKLLEDGWENRSMYSADSIAMFEYSVRAQAMQSLKALGKPVPKLPLSRKPTALEQHNLRSSYWTKTVGAAMTDGWRVVSVQDGETRKIHERDSTAVVVTCAKGDSRISLRLIPKQWGAKCVDSGENMGINGRHSQGARVFYLEGALPAGPKNHLREYFGLEPG